MKKLIIMFIILGFAITVNCQVKYHYCELVISSKGLSAIQVEAAIDSGQIVKLASNDRFIKDETGKIKAFPGTFAAINYMAEKGWEYVDALPISEVTGGKVYHFIMRRQLKP